MIKEADLPADRTYVFGYHPHGIISMGAVATFATEYTGFSENYPGIKSHLLTLGELNLMCVANGRLQLWHPSLPRAVDVPGHLLCEQAQL
jgi:hypothetical protein